MRRYIFDRKISEGEKILIEGELFKHIFKICRRNRGDKFELLAVDKAYLVKVESIEKDSAQVLVESSSNIPKLKKPYIHLVVANPRPAVFEKVVEKAVELGVKSIYPVITEKSFFKNVEKLKFKEKRIHKIIKQAMQQTRRIEDLHLNKPTDLKEFLHFFTERRELGGSRGFMLYEAPLNSEIELSFSRNVNDENIFILVGGEGGFSTEEATNAVSAGFKALLLGEQILRVETACVAGISILKSELGIW